MDAHLVFGLALLMQTTQPPAIPTQVSPPKITTLAPTTQPASLRCDARPWQRLVGRTVGDILTITLPLGTRVYRVDDPPSKAATAGQLTVEIARSTRVRRVYCS
jgi:hypothetical protein